MGHYATFLSPTTPTEGICARAPTLSLTVLLPWVLLAVMGRIRVASLRELQGRVIDAIREFAVHDWVILAYLSALIGALLSGAQSPARTRCLFGVTVEFAFAATVIVAFRARMLRWRVIGPALYRLAVFGTLMFTYLQLREILPVVNPGSADAELLRIDTLIFRVEPTIWLERFVNPRATEWFSFFYFSYYVLVMSHIGAFVLLGCDDRRMAEFGLAIVLLYGASFLLYMVVPGYGPFNFLAKRFTVQLPDGFWLWTIRTIVEKHGAQKDIFPSLHTGAPLFLALFSIRHRRTIPFKYTWFPVTFFAVNIIIATIYLRWHYLIDVVAGIAVATCALAVAVHVAETERRRRESLGLQQVWGHLLE